MEKYSVVDLFAGAGGLSLGFMQSNMYIIKAAFENSPHMQETYKHNHPDVDVRGDVCTADYSEIQEKHGKIDVVIGGPPCQGFSNANRQKNTAVSKNNMLVKQYIRAIQELQPKAFVMENVSMLQSKVHRFYMDKKDEKTVSKYGITTKETTLELLDESLTFNSIRKYIDNHSLINNDLLTDDQYAKLNVIYKAAKSSKKLIAALKKHNSVLIKYAAAVKNSKGKSIISTASKDAFAAIEKYYVGSEKAENIKKCIEPAIMYQRMLAKLKEIFDNDLIVERWETKKGFSAVIRSYAVFDYIKAVLESAPNNYKIKADVLCAADYGAPQKRMRFVIIGIKKEICSEVKMPEVLFSPKSYRTVKDAIYDLERVSVVTNLSDDTGTHLPEINEISELGQELRNAETLKNHIATNTTKVALERFKKLKPGQNFHSLDDSLKNNTYTDVSRTQNTIYLRLKYGEPCGTVVNVRKSMWIHPALDRAVSVREAARLQTFPDSFIFYGTKDKQYQQVGNAVPPIMAKAIAEAVASQLKSKNEMKQNG